MVSIVPSRHTTPPFVGNLTVRMPEAKISSCVDGVRNNFVPIMSDEGSNVDLGVLIFHHLTNPSLVVAL